MLPRIKPSTPRDRHLTPEEVRRLHEACPVHLQHVVKCVLHTGMRRGEVLTLKWNQIRNGWIYLPKTKTNRKRQIPVSDELARLFDHIKDGQGKDKSNVVDLKGRPVEVTRGKSEYVFTYKGKPIKEVKHAFKTACERAGLVYGRDVPSGITFHTLRHSYGSYLMQQKTDFRTTQELMGHKDPKMTQRYTHVADDTKRRAVNDLDWDL